MSMSTVAYNLRRVIGRSRPTTQSATAEVSAPAPATTVTTPVDLAPNDPLLPYLQSAPGAVDVDSLELESAGLEKLRANGVKLVVPLVTQGELIGMLSLGPRLSDQEYSRDDRRLLENLAAQAAPAVRVGQLVREQEAEIRNRERLDAELAVARLIQQNFLPRQVPQPEGWGIAAAYQPAREVGGDFYDFIELEPGKLGIVIGDVTDKGVPAALVMAATRSVLRAAAQRLLEPGAVLARVNEHLCPDIPENMFVTCLYGVLEVASGRLVFANAGHNLPIVALDGKAEELRARGMPLGLMTGMTYEQTEAVLAPGAQLLLYSDGVTEAHDPQREMFGSGRLAGELAAAGRTDGAAAIARVLESVQRFTGETAEQEDDITLVTINREPELAELADFTVASAPGNERAAIDQVAAALSTAGLDADKLERLKTAVGEATMNAMEHGNGFDESVPVRVRVLAAAGEVRVRISDGGHVHGLPEAPPPDLEAKLSGDQTPRGWGLFLIRNMVDDVRPVDGPEHTLELVVHRDGRQG